ncbi:OmpA family protein [Actinomadura sp. DC4]|uniref:OmpA family protein n=1 Tax=Actinomadura sp. DC4 TaxID=3055069 RepID=UPI0025AF5B18|nr:OmpA family protein [Actinomadura sp. DC4]MDN3356889.1 OmpA family protein [Actinomadura sp. DC4]
MLASVLALAGCSGGKKPDGGKSTTAGGGKAANEKAIAAEPMALDEGPAHVDLIALRRTANNTVTARLRVVNDGRESIGMAGVLSDSAPKKGAEERGAGGIALLDGAADKAYYPLTTGTGVCLCSDSTGDLAAGQALDVYAVFPAPPPQTNRVTVWVPRALPFADAEIRKGQAPPAPDQSLDPAKAALGRPTIRPLIDSSESADEAVDEDGDNRTVRLSADVLFAYDKADLTSKARAVLGNVARQIDASKGDLVRIDGYTDDSGDDAVNQPLSERRAQAVQTAFTAMVTRRGITYRSAGHGSQHPIAKNDDEAGRKRNRRVTITFAKPVPQARPPAATAGPPAPWTPGARLPVLATLRPRVHTGIDVEEEAGNIRFDINELHRDPSGLVTLVWTATGVGGAEQPIQSRLDKWASLEYTDGINTSGVSLLDRAGRTRYWPSRDGAGACVCSSLRQDLHGTQAVAPGAGATFVDVYKVPASVRAVDVQFSWDTLTLPAGNVTVG